MGQIHICVLKRSQKLVFGPKFLASNDYIKLVTLQTWMHFLFVLVVFQMILCSIEHEMVNNVFWSHFFLNKNIIYVSKHFYINVEATTDSPE